MGYPPPFWATCTSASYSCCERLFSYLLPKSTLFKVKTVSPCPITTDPAKESVPFFPVTPLQVMKGCYQVTLVLSFLQAEQPQLFQLFLVGEVLKELSYLNKWICIHEAAL